MIQPQGGDAVFTLILRLPAPSESGPVRIVRAELRHRSHRHDITFSDAMPVADAVAPALVDGIASLLGTVPADGPHDLTPEGHDLSIPGLVLGQVRIVASAPRKGGHRTVALRFSHVVGGVQRAFAVQTCFESPTLDAREELGVRALEDVVTPLLNMATTIRNAPQLFAGSDRVDAQLEEIESRANELEYHAALLRRYVTDCAPERRRFVDPDLCGVPFPSAASAPRLPH